MIIRKAKEADLPAMEALFAGARERMRANGNPNQWGDRKPYPEAVREDLRLGRAYLLIGDDPKNKGEWSSAPEKAVFSASGERVCGTFVFYIGEDPNYRSIAGKWLNHAPYGVIHRIAGDGFSHGVLEAAVDFAQKQIGNIRIDTHEDNAITRHLLDRLGFIACGVILLEDGAPRIAYQKAAE